MKNRGKIILILILMSISISVLVYSFAYTTQTNVGEEINYLSVSDISFGLTDSVESIDLGSLTPTIDKFGLMNDSFSFSITNTSEEQQKYVVKLVDKSVSTIPNNEIRYQLIKAGVEGEIKNLADTGILDAGALPTGESLNYSIKVWLGYDASTTDGIWSKVVKVEAGNIKLDTSGANEPVMLSNMVPVYYDKTDSVWRKADANNFDINHQWYNYDERMWANAVTVKKVYYGEELMSSTGQIEDLSGNGNNATFVGGPMYSEKGLVLDGVDDGILLDNNFVNGLFNKDNTVQIKMKRDTNGYDVLFGNYPTAPALNYVIIDTNLYRVYATSPNNTTQEATYGRMVLYSFVYTSANNTVNIYEDNNLVATITSSSFSSFYNSLTTVYIGRDSREGDSATAGTIEKVMIYERALTPSEIASNLNNDIIENDLKLYYDFLPYTSAPAGRKILMDDITSFYVWIPRFKYNLFTNGSPKVIDVSFERRTTSSATMKCTISGGGQSCSGDAISYTHPAFTFDGKELPGFWISKFELSPEYGTTCYNSISTSNCNKANLSLTSKPNQKSLYYISIGNLFKSVRSMELKDNIHSFINEGTTLNADGSIANDSNNFDIHLSKSFESAALSYLTYSKYGKYTNPSYSGDNKHVFNNNGSSKTGSSYLNNTTYAYDVDYYGTGASTTGNIYGVYDLNGYIYEYVMMNVLSSSGAFYESSSSTSSFVTAPLAKYYDGYAYTSSPSSFKSMYGDAIDEFKGFTTNTSSNPYYYYPFIARKTVDSVYYSRGGTSTTYGGRAVITIESNEQIYITEW